MKDVPASPGIYVVISSVAEQPSFLTSSIGGHFKRNDSTVAVSALVSRQPPGPSSLRGRWEMLAEFVWQKRGPVERVGFCGS